MKQKQKTITVLGRPEKVKGRKKLIQKKLKVKVPDLPNIAAIRLDRNQRWPSKPSEHCDHRRKIFKAYLENELNYDFKDITLLLKLWDHSIDADNIHGYNHCTTAALYQGLINDNLSILYRDNKQ